MVTTREALDVHTPRQSSPTSTSRATSRSKWL